MGNLFSSSIKDPVLECEYITNVQNISYSTIEPTDHIRNLHQNPTVETLLNALREGGHSDLLINLNEPTSSPDRLTVIRNRDITGFHYIENDTEEIALTALTANRVTNISNTDRRTENEIY